MSLWLAEWGDEACPVLFDVEINAFSNDEGRARDALTKHVGEETALSAKLRAIPSTVAFAVEIDLDADGVVMRPVGEFEEKAEEIAPTPEEDEDEPQGESACASCGKLVSNALASCPFCHADFE